MDFHLILSNLTNPVLLFFALGMTASWVKSDLEIPSPISKFISLYLLFAIGFKGGQELAHSELSPEIGFSVLFGIFLSAGIPLYTFFILKRKLPVQDAAAVSAAYGSVSAVTFVSAVSFLEIQQIPFSGYMVAVMALMESPAIIVAVILMATFSSEGNRSAKLGSIIAHSFTNGSVLLILGSLLIGMISDSSQAEGIRPFTTDIFKGFLALFLLDMGMVTARRLSSFRNQGAFLTLFALGIPVVNGCIGALASGWVTPSEGNRLLFAVLAASASYIAVPAAMKLAAPKADPGIYIPMALGVTFPLNITLGIPLFYLLITF